MDLSFSSTSDTKNLYNLLCITEELLFSIPLHSDLVEKYIVLRETGLKKVGIASNSSNLWELQKQAHQELNQKYSSQEKQIKDLSENLDVCRHSYKELYDTSSKFLEFCKDINADLLKSLDKPVLNRGFKENLQISLISNQTHMNKNIFGEFSVLKEEIRTNLAGVLESRQQETQKTLEKALESKFLFQEYESKIKDLQRRLDLVEEESRLKSEKLLIEQRRLHCKEVDDLKSRISLLEAKRSKEIEEVKESYEKELRLLHEEKNYAIENLSASIKTSHKQELKELELSFRAKENELLEELDIATNTDSSVLKNLRENLEKCQIKVQDLREVLRAIEERTQALFQKYAYKDDLAQEFSERKKEISNITNNKAWQQYSEVLTQLDFMSLAFKKMTSDNEWLVEQIDELTKENEGIKSQQRMDWKEDKFFKHSQEQRILEEEALYMKEMQRIGDNQKDYSYEQVLTTLSANEVVIKDFQDARSKLLKQFAEAKRNY